VLPPLQVYPGSIEQSDEQPSLETTLASSQASLPTRTPSPHTAGLHDEADVDPALEYVAASQGVHVDDDTLRV
jgi:hypothetical protein